MPELNFNIVFKQVGSNIVSQVGQQLDQIGTASKQSAASLGQLTSAFSKIGSLFSSFLGAAGIGAAIRQFGELDQAQRRLAANVEKNTRLTSASTAEFEKQASTLSKLGAVSRASITNTQGQLASIGLATDDVLAVTKAIVELQNRTGKDVEQITENVTGGLLGTTSVDTLNEQYDLKARSTTQLIQELRSLSSTGSGNSFNRLFTQINDLLAQFGKLLNNVFGPSLNAIAGFVSDLADAIASFNRAVAQSPALKAIAGTIGAGIAGGLVLSTLSRLATVLSTLATTLAASSASKLVGASGIGNVLGSVAAAVVPSATTTGFARLASILTTLGAVALRVAGVVGIIIVVFDATRNFLKGLIDSLPDSISAGIKSITSDVGTFFDKAATLLRDFTDRFESTFQALGEAVGKVFKGDLSGFKNLRNRAGEILGQKAGDRAVANSKQIQQTAVTENFEKTIQDLELRRKAIESGLLGERNINKEIAAARGERTAEGDAKALQLENDLSNELLATQTKILDVRRRQNEFIFNTFGAGEAFKKSTEGLVDARDKLNQYETQVQQTSDALKNFNEDLSDNQRQFLTNIATEKLETAGNQRLSEEMRRIVDLYEKLKDAKKLGFSDQQIKAIEKELVALNAYQNALGRISEARTRSQTETQIGDELIKQQTLKGGFIDAEGASRQNKLAGLAEEINLTQQAIEATKKYGEAVGVDVTPKIDELTLSLAQLQTQQAEAQTQLGQFQQILSDNFGTAFDSLIDGTKSVSEAFGDMAKSIISDITKILVKAALTNVIGSIFGSGGPLGFLGSAFGGAQSGLSGGFHFATGGVVPGALGAGDIVPAMLSPGEIVLNHAQQARLASRLSDNTKIGGGTQVTNINVFNENDLVNALQQTKGKNVILNHMTSNKLKLSRTIQPEF